MQVSVESVKPGGTGIPIRAISARFAPLPPSRSRMSAPPSACPAPNWNTRWVVEDTVTPLCPDATGRSCHGYTKEPFGRRLISVKAAVCGTPLYPWSSGRSLLRPVPPASYRDNSKDKKRIQTRNLRRLRWVLFRSRGSQCLYSRIDGRIFAADATRGDSTGTSAYKTDSTAVRSLSDIGSTVLSKRSTTLPLRSMRYLLKFQVG